jgi:hypothetical protein
VPNSGIRLFGSRLRNVAQHASLRHAPLRRVVLVAAAIHRSPGERRFRHGVPSLVPSDGPAFRRRSLLGGVPRDGSPASTLVLRRSDFSSPIPPRFVAFAWRYRRYSAVGDDETSQVPVQPLRTCLGLRSRWSRCAEVPGFALRLRAPMLPSAALNASASRTRSISGLHPRPARRFDREVQARRRFRLLSCAHSARRRLP